MTENTPTPPEDIQRVRDWAVSEQGWDDGAFNRVLGYAAERGARARNLHNSMEANAALAAILAEAPHGTLCGAYVDPFWPDPAKCDCWKSKLPADALAARDAEKWAEGAEAGYADGDQGRVGEDCTRNPYRIERESKR